MRLDDLDAAVTAYIKETSDWDDCVAVQRFFSYVKEKILVELDIARAERDGLVNTLELANSAIIGLTEELSKARMYRSRVENELVLAENKLERLETENSVWQ